MKRLLLALGTAMLVLLLAEGFLSLVLQRSLRHPEALPFAARGPSGPGGGLGAATAAGAAAGEGLYRVHPDPRVGYVLRPNAELAIFDGVIHSDALGLRVRPGPPRDESALRIVVLGDSVAFGFGLDDDETLAHRLEGLLTDAARPGARAVMCRTVAIPGWNHRNAVGFLLDHWDALRPGIVVYLPSANDLFDTDALDETGHRRWQPDAAARDPWLAVSPGPGFKNSQRDTGTPGSPGAEDIAGVPALVTDLSPESSRRYEENVDSIARLDAALRVRGGHLLLVQYQEGIYPAHLVRYLHERGVDAPLLALFTRVPRDLTLGFDPHPNADTVAAMASWVAAALAGQGWVDADAARLPAVARAPERARAPQRSTAEIVAGSAMLRDSQRAMLRAVLDYETGEGTSQVYGGVQDDGVVGAHALLMLKRGGGTLRVRLAPLAGRADLYPLAVEVAIDGQPAGRIVIGADGPAEVTLPMPTAAVPPGTMPPDTMPPGAAPAGATGAGTPAVEVLLRPERSVMTGPDDGFRLAAFQVVRIACE